jgi:hypothetical protein
MKTTHVRAHSRSQDLNSVDPAALRSIQTERGRESRKVIAREGDLFLIEVQDQPPYGQTTYVIFNNKMKTTVSASMPDKEWAKKQLKEMNNPPKKAKMKPGQLKPLDSETDLDLLMEFRNSSTKWDDYEKELEKDEDPDSSETLMDFRQTYWDEWVEYAKENGYEPEVDDSL